MSSRSQGILGPSAWSSVQAASWFRPTRSRPEVNWLPPPQPTSQTLPHLLILIFPLPLIPLSFSSFLLSLPIFFIYRLHLLPALLHLLISFTNPPPPSLCYFFSPSLFSPSFSFYISLFLSSPSSNSSSSTTFSSSLLHNLHTFSLSHSSISCPRAPPPAPATPPAAPARINLLLHLSFSSF